MLRRLLAAFRELRKQVDQNFQLAPMRTALVWGIDGHIDGAADIAGHRAEVRVAILTADHEVVGDRVLDASSQGPSVQIGRETTATEQGAALHVGLGEGPAAGDIEQRLICRDSHSSAQGALPIQIG